MAITKIQSESLNLADDYAFTGTITGAGGGKVLQVVTATYATAQTSTSSTFVDTGLTANITPSSASSKILVFFSIVCNSDEDLGYRQAKGSFKILRDSTSIIDLKNDAFGFYVETASGGSLEVYFSLNMPVTYQYLDSPSTTSATTYKIQFANISSGANTRFRVFQNNSTGVLTLIEIGA